MNDILGTRTESILNWLIGIGIDFSGPLEFQRLGLGQSNLTYIMSDTRSRRWVLRRPPHGNLLDSAHDVQREARILSALNSSSVPVPKIYGSTADPLVTDFPLVVMEYVEGTVVDQMSVAESLTPHRRSEIGSSMARTLAMIHAVDVDKVGLSNLASRSPYALRQLKRWSGQLENSKTRDLPVLDELTRRLTEGAPKQLEVTLVHGDFHLRNVITSPANGEVDAVLDWELSTLGDPLADLGGLLAYWVEPGEESGVEFPATSLVGFPTRNQMIDAYVEISDRDPTYVPYWRALGLWKLAIIAQGVMLRATAVPSNKSAIGTPTNEQVDSFVRRALFAAEEAAI